MSRESRLHRDGDHNNSYNHQRDRDEHHYYRNQESVRLERREPRESRGQRHGHRTSNPVNSINSERRHGTHHEHDRPSSSRQYHRRVEENDDWSNSANQGSHGDDYRYNPRVHFEVSPEPESPRPVQSLYDPRRRNRRAEIQEAIRQAEEILPPRGGSSGRDGRQAEVHDTLHQFDENFRRGGSGSHRRQAEAHDTLHQFDENFRRGGSGSHGRRH